MNINLKSTLCCLIFLVFGKIISQEAATEYKVKYTSDVIKIDGIAGENDWKTANTMSANWQHFPNEINKFSNPTEVKILFDDQNIYLLCKSYSKSNNYVIPSLKWDFSGRAADKVNFVFDTFSDGNNAYMFGSNMLGVKSDILVSNGGVGEPRSDLNRSWDGDFDVEGGIYDGYYLIEMKIPLTTFHYPENATSWRFNFFRFDTQENQRTTWIRTPQQFRTYNLAFMGKIIFEKPLRKPGGKVSIIPYATGFAEKDFSNKTNSNDIDFGGDIKIPIGSGLNLDLTYNPDFSQVEVDDEIVNLRRFEIKFPEKRQFFLQNNDIFSNFGAVRTITPFFTRRIGLSRNLDGEIIENKIIGGLRLSGKVNNNLKLGVLSMLTEEDLKNNIPSNLNTVISLHQKVFNRSALKFLFINRETTEEYDFVEKNDKYNRLIGLEYDLNSKDNIWNGRFFTYNSFSPLKNENGFSGGVRVKRETRTREFSFEYSYLGDDFRSDLGILRRVGVSKFCPYYAHKFYPKKGKINNIRIGFYYWLWFNFSTTKENILENNYLIPLDFSFNDQSSIELRYFRANEYLPNDFDPTGINKDNPLPGDRVYHSRRFSFTYTSKPTNKFFFEASQSFGKFYDGNIYSFSNSVFLRVQPRLVASMKFNYDRINFTHLEKPANLWLVGPKIDFTFTKKLYWASLIQFSSQSENLGINSRLQWRFKGLSNLYLVYNDNYDTTNRILPRRRSLNLKLVHWF